MREPVQSLWIGGRLSALEQLCIRSFLRHDHPFHLYVYDKPDGVPEDCELRNANEIIPFYDVFKIRGGYSSFSDFFRWKLILDRGGWWADTDAVCLRPFEFEYEYVFTGGLGAPGSPDCVSSGVFRAPDSSPVMTWLWSECQKMDPDTMPWGDAGPPLITQAVHKFGLQERIAPARLFFPIFYTLAPGVFIQADAPEIPKDAYSVHLFNEMWRLAGQDKDGTYPTNSLYETLKRTVDNAS